MTNEIITQTFQTAKISKKIVKGISIKVVSINGKNVESGLISVNNKHITYTDSTGISVFEAPFTVKFKNI